MDLTRTNLSNQQDLWKKREDTLWTEEIILNMGPQHPSTHGVLRLVLHTDGEVIKKCVPHLGYLHRGIEKNSEHKEYLQIIPLWDRADYLSSMHMSYLITFAAESLMKVEVPRRAEYIRVICMELQRIASHLIWFGTFALDSGAVTPIFYAFRERELVIDLLELASGARLLYNYIRPGGVRMDVNREFLIRLEKFLKHFQDYLDEYEELYTGNAIFINRAKNVGILKKEDAINWGASGPVLRGSGVKWDIRKDEPYSVYEEFDFDIPSGERGDVLDRYNVRFYEMRQSHRILKQALEGFPEGKYTARVPTSIKPEEGEVYVRIESPRGELGCYLVSDGGKVPYRLHVRAPSFVNLSALDVMLRGHLIADVVLILGSIDIVVGDIDR